MEQLLTVVVTRQFFFQEQLLLQRLQLQLFGQPQQLLEHTQYVLTLVTV